MVSFGSMMLKFCVEEKKGVELELLNLDFLEKCDEHVEVVVI